MADGVRSANGASFFPGSGGKITLTFSQELKLAPRIRIGWSPMCDRGWDGSMDSSVGRGLNNSKVIAAAASKTIRIERINFF